MLLRRAILILAAAALISMPVAAEEILHFKSGAALPVVSYEIKGDMVYADLGDDSLVAFPAANIARVEEAGAHVSLGQGNRTTSTSVMRVVGGNGSGGGDVAQSQDQGRTKRLDEPEEDPSVEVDDKGVAVYRPFPNSDQPAKRSIGLAGNRRARGGGASDVRGTRRVGNRYVIGTGGPRGNNSSSATRGSSQFEFKGAGAPVAKEEPAAGSPPPETQQPD